MFRLRRLRLCLSSHLRGLRLDDLHDGGGDGAAHPLLAAEGETESTADGAMRVEVDEADELDEVLSFGSSADDL